MSRFDPFIPPEPTVHCRCGWAGVGIQTQVVFRDSRRYFCPQCKKDKYLDWGKYKDQMREELKVIADLEKEEAALKLITK